MTAATRECGEHRELGTRAWCFDCSEYCYDDVPCRGCELPPLRAELERLRSIVSDLAALEPYDDEYNVCGMCLATAIWDYRQRKDMTVHEPGCPWLRATQETKP